MKEDDLENSNGSRVLIIILVTAALIAILYLFFGRNEKVEPNKYEEICKPFHFVKSEWAAKGLTKVYCLDKSGEKKEILIEE